MISNSDGSILAIDRLNAYYGTAHVLFDLSLAVPSGTTLAVLGRNGAGKSTLLKSVMRLDVQTTGSIRYSGSDITLLPPFKVARLGIGYVPGDRRIYPDLTVRENLDLGRHSATGRSPLTVGEILESFPTLGSLIDRKGGAVLSGGEQQLLAVARALVGNPDLLLLDEPSEGLAPVIVHTVGEAIRKLKANHGVSILLAEQNAQFAMALADTVAVIDEGRIVFAGTADEFRAAKDVQSRYLAV